MKSTRRLFLKQGGIALASVGIAPAFGPSFLRRTVYADDLTRDSRAGGGKKVLICIFQRGAVDGLSMVVPHGDPYYYQHRSVGNNGIALARTGPGGIIDLDGTFGLHPSLRALKPIYDAGYLAPIQACGSPNPSRSHFDAQDYMESGAPGDKAVRDGWLARTIACCPEDAARQASAFRAVSMTTQVPRSLQGDGDALAIPDLQSFGINGGAAGIGLHTAGAAGGFEAMYDDAVGDVLHGAGKETFEALKIVKQINATPYVPENGARYPRGRFGESLQQIAELIKADVGLEIAFSEVGGWDTHVQQGGAQGRLARSLQEFGDGLAALYTDLGDRMGNVVVLTMSEFGRTVHQNGNGGTDHGHATCFFVMGGGVHGGKVQGTWPGLAPEQLYENRDLAVTTDFRSVFGEVAQKHLGVRDLAQVLPGSGVTPGSFPGLLTA